MQKTLISIVIPVYRTSPYLEACIESLLNQDFQGRYNILLVETASDDGSDAICQEYEKKNVGKVYHFHYGNRYSVSMARNIGLSHANGEYVTFVDGDDVVEPDYLSTLYQQTQNKEKPDIVIASYYSMDADGKKKRIRTIPFQGNGKDALLKLIHKRKSTFRGYCWGCLYRRQFLIHGKLAFADDMKLYEDFLFMGEALFRANMVSVIDVPIYDYLFHESSTMATNKDWLSWHLKSFARLHHFIQNENEGYAKRLFSRLGHNLSGQIILDCKKQGMKHKETKKMVRKAKAVWSHGI